MEWNEIKIDEAAIASGMLNLFDEDDVGPLAYGMLPALKMECLEKNLGDKFDEVFRDKFGVSIQDAEEITNELGLPPGFITDDFRVNKNDFVRKVTHAVSVEIYRQASKTGRMIV